jgi:hypothetical protein
MDKVHRWRDIPFHVWLSREEMKQLNYVLSDYKGNRAEKFRVLVDQLYYKKKREHWKAQGMLFEP